VSKRQSRKQVKEARRRKKLRERTRRHRTKGNEKDTPGGGHQRASLDPYSYVAWRDAKKNTRLFWSHETNDSYQIRALSDDSSTGGQFLFGEKAQEKIRPLIEDMLHVIRDQIQSREALRWLVLVRPNLRMFLGEFMDGKGYPGLTKQDRLGVLGMMELSIAEYGQRKNYFETYRLKGPPDGASPSECAANIPPIPEKDIVALRHLLNNVVILYRFEKLFRIAGRGTGISIEPPHGIRLFKPRRISDGYWLYDRRVQAQQESGQSFVSAGIPGITELEESSSDTLLVMTRLRSAEHLEFMKQLHGHDPHELSAINYCPGVLDLAGALGVLRKMPEGTARKTGGLTPDDIAVCLGSISRIGIVAFNDRTTRFWLGCYGLLPISQKEFAKRFEFHAKELRHDYSEAKIDEVRDKFVTTFSLPRRQGRTEFDRSNVHRYMTASHAFGVIEEGQGIMIDYLGLPHDLSSWLLSLRLDGAQREPKRGILFENWLCLELAGCVSEHFPGTKAMPQHSLDVRIESKRSHTDIDVVLPIPPWMIVISCKNYEMKDGEFRGVAKDVWNRWVKLSGDLAAWDDKMRHLFLNGKHDWRILNPKLVELAEGCSHVLPILITPRVEWIPVLKPELLLHPGRHNGKGVTTFPIPRIGTLDDLKRMFLMGGPKPVQLDWVIGI